MREKARERKREGEKHKWRPNQIPRSNWVPEQGRQDNIILHNYPMETTVMELWDIFNKFWKVGEVYIPTKLDKAGK
ncbi:hypothetical protein A2U01_0050505, partial [Trifolium medium]|nr:hypothetical protein [Trifolium medium]